MKREVGTPSDCVLLVHDQVCRGRRSLTVVFSEEGGHWEKGEFSAVSQRHFGLENETSGYLTLSLLQPNNRKKFKEKDYCKESRFR